MSETLKNGHDSFETEDLRPQAIFYFMAGLAIVVVVIYFIVIGMYRILDAYDKKHELPGSPMAVKTGVDPRSMPFPKVLSQIGNTFPKPVLEHSEQLQFREILEKQDQTLASYDWIDQKQGIVRIPIDKAMELLAQRGLPVLPQGAAGQAAAPATKETKAKRVSNKATTSQ